MVVLGGFETFDERIFHIFEMFEKFCTIGIFHTFFTFNKLPISQHCTGEQLV